MNIAIVDDVQADRRLLAEKISEYMTIHNLHCDITEFESGEAFLDAFTSGGFALVFIDIYMNGINGMEVAKKIFAEDSECKIIFLTICRDFAIQGYGVRAVYYLVKPIDDTEFFQAMELCRFNQQRSTPMLTVVSEGIEITIDTANILYIDYIERVTRIHMTTQVFRVNGTFSEVTAPLCGNKQFIICLRGVMVNMRQVLRQDDDMFVLQNGERVPINIRRKKTIGQVFRKFVYEEMEEIR